jgi:long-chain fatty acid transport protein
MNMNKKLIGLALVAALGLALTASTSFAAGFALYEYSSRGDAMGGSLLGVADDASTLAYNPAGVGFLKKFSVVAGVSTVTPHVDVKTRNMYDGTETTTSADETTHLLPHVYIAGPLWEKTGLGKMSFGVSTYSRFGLANEFREHWVGRYNSYKAQLLTYSVIPTLAYAISDKLSFSLGLEILKFHLDLRQKIDATGLFAATGQTAVLESLGLPTTVNDPSTNFLDVDQKLRGQSHGFGYNLAMMYRPTEWLGMGIHYRSEIDLDVGGQAHYERPAIVETLLPGLYQFSTVTGRITLPASVTGGVNFLVGNTLNLGASVVFTRWSSYDKLALQYDKPNVGVDSVSKDKKFDDAWRFQFGVEWNALDWLAVRGAYIYDESPLNDGYVDYLLPSNNRNLFGLGLGFKIGNARIDVNYTYLMVDSRTVTGRQVQDGVMDGEFTNGDAQIWGATFVYTF